MTRMGKRARDNRREKQRISLQVARAELTLLLDGKVKPYLLELDLHKTWNVVSCLRQNGYIPIWATPPDIRRAETLERYGGYVDYEQEIKSSK